MALNEVRAEMQDIAQLLQAQLERIWRLYDRADERGDYWASGGLADVAEHIDDAINALYFE